MNCGGTLQGLAARQGNGRRGGLNGSLVHSLSLRMLSGPAGLSGSLQGCADQAATQRSARGICSSDGRWLANVSGARAVCARLDQTAPRWTGRAGLIQGTAREPKLIAGCAVSSDAERHDKIQCDIAPVCAALAQQRPALVDCVQGGTDDNGNLDCAHRDWGREEEAEEHREAGSTVGHRHPPAFGCTILQGWRSVSDSRIRHATGRRGSQYATSGARRRPALPQGNR